MVSRTVQHPGIVVCQHGARRRYAIPRMLDQEGLLVAFYTDSSSVSRLGRLSGRFRRRSPAFIQRLVNRKPEGVSGERIFSSDCCLMLEIRKRLPFAPKKSDLMEARYRRLSRKMKQWGLRGAGCVYSMYDENREFVRWAKAQGALSVVDVFISPATDRIMAAEEATFPDWSGPDISAAEQERAAVRWKEVADYADMLICPSEWVAEGVREMTPEAAGKIQVVPYGCSIEYGGRINKPVKGRILFAGGDALRKGLHYLAAAASVLSSRTEGLDFRIAGLLPQHVIEHPLCKELNFLGKLTSRQMADEFLAAECFVLPSLSEGFAGVVAEAVGAGCPVVVTKEAGSPVVDGREGVVVPSRSADALVNAIGKMVQDDAFRRQCSLECLAQKSYYAEAQWRQRLVAPIRKLIAG